jgi:hypothetical protein
MIVESADQRQRCVARADPVDPVTRGLDEREGLEPKEEVSGGARDLASLLTEP